MYNIYLYVYITCYRNTKIVHSWELIYIYTVITTI